MLSGVAAGTEQSRQRELRWAQERELKARSWSRVVGPWASQGRRSCAWSLCATHHTGGMTHTTLEQMSHRAAQPMRMNS